MTTAICAHCGAPLDEHDRDIRFVQPEPVLRAAPAEPGDVWMTGTDAEKSVLMQVQNVGTFVRTLLPVRLTGGFTVTYGVWVAIDPAELSHVMDAWWAPEYADLHLEGRLANVVAPWGLCGSPVTLRVLEDDQIPHCVASADDSLTSVLNDEWEHQLVLDTLP